MTRIYSLDPVQNAELAAEHAAEARITGVSVETYWGENDYEEDREWGDVSWDEEEEGNYWEDRLEVLIFILEKTTNQTARAEAWKAIREMAREADAFRNEER